MAFDINVFYNVLKSIYDDYSAKEQAVKFDVDLSDAGRQKKLDKINSDRIKAVTQLQETYQKEFDKSMAVIDKTLNGKRESVSDKAREYLKRHLTKDVGLSTYNNGDAIIDGNSETQLILDAIESTHRERMSFAKAQAKSMRDIDWIRGDIQKAINDGDVEKLEEYQQVAELIPNGKDSDSLMGILTPAIAKAKLDRMSPEQRQALNTKQTLEHDKELLDYSFKNVSERNEYRDARQVNKEPTTTLKYVGGSGRVTQNKV